MRGRKPKPSSLKRLLGNPGRRPLNDDEPRPAPVASVEPPDYLDAAGQAVWRALVPHLAACGLLTALDVPKLELLCIHLAFHRRLYALLTAALAEQEASGVPVDTSRLIRSLRQTADTVRSLSAGFGLDPADRVRLHVPRPADRDDPFAEFDAPRSKWAGVLP
jgi:P27 family predicted phage terminase small subunit